MNDIDDLRTTKHGVPPRYPLSRVEDLTEMIAGIEFMDPFRWLEGETPEVRVWQRAQGRLATHFSRSWKDFERLHALVARYNTPRHITLPRQAGGKWFRILPGNANHGSQLILANTPMGDGRVLFEPESGEEGVKPVISWVAPAPDAKTVAIGVCTDGSEVNRITLVDVATGDLLPSAPVERLMDNWTGGVQWLPDSTAFFFTAITGSAEEFDQQVYLHRRAPIPVTERAEVPWISVNDYRMVVVARDGRHAIAVERLLNPIPVAVARLDAPTPLWRPFMTSVPGTFAGHLIGDELIGVTDVDAPRGRLVAVPLNVADPNNTTEWRELVPQGKQVLRTATPVGDLLYLTELVDTYSALRVVDFNGVDAGVVRLPGKGSVMEYPFPLMSLFPRGDSATILFGFSSFTQSPTLCRHMPGFADCEVLQGPAVTLRQAEVEDRWAVSADGTSVPYHLVGNRVDSGLPRPTLIYAYGGYNDPFPPKFPGPMAAFVTAGGLLVHAHLRGGGELGRDWWEGGRMAAKQNCYDDLYAIAEALIADGISASETLAVVGGSNGGLMAGVAATQRPDLWAAAVPRVPLLDLIGACRSPYGRQAIEEELGDPENPNDIRRLAAISPYHLVRDTIRYPAIYIDAGDTDPRCPAWHARKFAARLQSATASASPILLKVWENAGHGWATDPDLAAVENAEWLAFLMKVLRFDYLPPETDW